MPEIDRSNIEANCALQLPLDPDRSAERIRHCLRKNSGVDVGVIIIDSIGRSWRNGTIDTVIGASGVTTLRDLPEVRICSADNWRPPRWHGPMSWPLRRP